MVLVCLKCGAQYCADATPSICMMCADERGSLGRNGQEWAKKSDVFKTHKNSVHEEEPGLLSIGTEPLFGIGQRALLIQTGVGNILWDCINILQPETAKDIHSRGGIQAIAISHPHFFGGIATWAEEFDSPVYIHEKDKQFVTEPNSHIQPWSGDEKELFGGARLLRLGGHFPGSAVLHWSGGADGKGILCTGDTIQGLKDRRWVAFMLNFPLYMPLPADQVARIGRTVKAWQLDFERLHCGWTGQSVDRNAKQVVIKSAEHYVGLLDGSVEREYF
ncbi:hypothetical protein CVIRNUC_004176 [Coccomyxa viridis]|uniref:Metallo-beta-lactamase domain-containing protein n=1 Tax=Coccomyxa viridis TaxID=1274662 RepID=A0AAV1I2B1_9CHLO|nr:hypothetical protein CVIRNUC_004176 [Coccomyxa viridis]